ncbi:hypothetical protein CBLAS_0020 [Campylobacter blaseri]|uniref:Ankyrin repeat domain-containing protein n=1 Tax=Campylobacter blaseri TaxID=2042961 RepID=A0A2P8R3H8_9BACT|nr:hypothetical protein [Campylobacter blaseri]PSM53047.1 hypothetical protein CQ405_00385 [Campylobacter blaseri]PSM54514.1 hypothetical protein CRN67_00385 [Campylobacter blaseri]QKF85238.1 hypothetical protein CBLAS_0020 [Campylobacter blaseri]
MKQIFKIILFLSLILSFGFSNTMKDNNTTLQEQNLAKQVEILNEAIMADDYEKIKSMLDKNPALVNTADSYGNRPIFKLLIVYSMSKFGLSEFDNVFEKYIEIFSSYGLDLNFVEDEIMTPLQTVVLLPTKHEYKIYLLDTLVKYGADINFGNNRGLPYVLISATENEKIFDYLLSKNINVANYLFWDFVGLIQLVKFKPDITPDTQMLQTINSKKYQILRNDVISRANKLFKYHKISYFNKKELEIVTKFLVFTNDIECIKLFIENGLLECDKEFLEKLISYTKEHKRDEILELLKGDKYV